MTRPWASSWPRNTPRQPGITTHLPTSRRSSPGWSWSVRASPRHRPGGRGCPSRYCGTARATCWPAWHDAKPDPESASLYGPASAVSGTSSPVVGSPEHHAVRHALAGDGGDAAHGAGQPAIVELQGPGQVRAWPAVGAVPFGGQGGQLPDGVDVAWPAVPQLVAAVVLAQHGVSPPPQLGQPRVVGVVVQAYPGGSGRSTGSDGFQGGGDCPGEFLEASDEVQAVADTSAIEPLADQRDLAAKISHLRGQGSETLPQSMRGRVGPRAGHGPPRPYSRFPSSRGGACGSDQSSPGRPS